MPFVTKQLADIKMRKSVKKTKLLLKNAATWKVVEVTVSDEGISTEELVQSQPWSTYPKNDARGTTDRRPGSGRPRSATCLR